MRTATRHGEFHLSYSTNVHPGVTRADLQRLLVADVGRVREAFAAESVAAGLSAASTDPFGVELCIGTAAARELSSPDAARDFKQFLADHGLYVFSLNAFPIRDFHAASVKENVYRPDWCEPERWETTSALCRFLAAILPDDINGSVSTSPGSFKPWGNARALRAEFARGYAPVLQTLQEIRDDCGKTIRLAIEPEPFCTLETIDEFIEFYESDVLTHTVQALGDEGDIPEATGRQMVRDFLGINLDTCHLAVVFDDPTKSLEKLAYARIPIVKLHVANAARVLNPDRNARGMRQLEQLAEPKYLHQTFAQDQHGRITHRAADLPAFLEFAPDHARAWQEIRCHFHLPIYGSATAPLGTTADITEAVLNSVMRAGTDTHIVNETYTWPIMAGENAGDVHTNIARELVWTRQHMERA